MSRLTRRLAAPLSVAALCAAFAGTASASITISNANPFGPSDTTGVTITSAPAGATQWTVAECNISSASPANWGRDCNAGTALNFAPISTLTRTLTVEDAFTDTSFVPGSAPLFTSTGCDGTGGSDRCAVVVSYYNNSFAQLGADVQAIRFQ
jgi:hypothetical protein